MNPNDKDKPAIRTNETGNNGQPNGNPNEEHITSDPASSRSCSVSL